MHRPPGSEQARATARRQFDRERATDEHRRLLNTRRWRRFSALILTERPTCQDCDRKPATDVHHVEKVTDAPDRLLDESNVLALCHECHATRTGKGE